MIGPTGTVRVMVATKPVDFRKGMEELAALVREAMGADPFCGTVYVFRAKRADRVKLIFWDGTGHGAGGQAHRRTQALELVVVCALEVCALEVCAGSGCRVARGPLRQANPPRSKSRA